MSDRSYLDFLEDILRGIEAVETYLEGMSYEEFEDDQKTIDAVVRNFEIIGEAANNLPESVRTRHGDLEWRGVIKFRNVMIHDYFQVDTRRIWDTYQQNLPMLKNQIRRIMEQEKDD